MSRIFESSLKLCECFQGPVDSEQKTDIAPYDLWCRQQLKPMSLLKIHTSTEKSNRAFVIAGRRASNTVLAEREHAVCSKIAFVEGELITTTQTGR